ncbi:hypothetical protein OSTOST_18970 [Ostertagia ostertagi]
MSVAVDEKDMNDVAEGGEKKLSKKELNKLAKAAKIAELKAQKASSQPKEEEAEDVSVGMYGSYGMIQSTDKKDIVFTKLSEIDASIHGQEVWVRGRVHAIRSKGKTCFLVLRQQFYTAQVTLFVGEKISKQMLKFVSNISKVIYF